MSNQEQHPASGLPLDNIEMLSQPLLTEEGHINEACMNELAAAIRNMPETHERLADEPEWNTPWVVTEHGIVGRLAQCAIELARGIPPHLEDVCAYLQACLSVEWERDIEMIDGGDGIRIRRLSLCYICKFLHETLGDMPHVLEWNDEEKMPVPLNWIDLSALFRNVCVGIRNERRYELAFNIALARENSECGGGA